MKINHSISSTGWSNCPDQPVLVNQRRGHRFSKLPYIFWENLCFYLGWPPNFFCFFTLRSPKTYFLAPPLGGGEAIHVTANMKDSSSGQSGKRNYQIWWPRPFPSGKWKITGPKSIGFRYMFRFSSPQDILFFFFWSLLSHAKFSCHPF